MRIKLYSEVRKSLKKEIVSLVLFFVMVYVGLLGVKDNHCISRPCRLDSGMINYFFHKVLSITFNTQSLHMMRLAQYHNGYFRSTRDNVNMFLALVRRSPSSFIVVLSYLRLAADFYPKMFVNIL